MTTISDETIEVLRHILDARINHATKETCFAWCSAKDIIEYALADNLECLRQFDYLDTVEEEEHDWDERHTPNIFELNP